MKKILIALVALVLVGVAVFIFSQEPQYNQDSQVQVDERAYVTPEPELGLKLMEGREIGGVSITPTLLVEDSRCAEGLQCFSAGRVVVKAKLSKGSTSVTKDLELGKPFLFGTNNVELVAVTPYPKNGETIAKWDYRFEFKVSSK